MSHHDKNTAEYQKMAGQFVDMWQKNVATLMNDSQFMNRFLQMMQQSTNHPKEQSEAPTTRPTAPPEPIDAALAECKTRLAGIEQRLFMLEHHVATLLARSPEAVVSGVGRAKSKPRAGTSSRK